MGKRTYANALALGQDGALLEMAATFLSGLNADGTAFTLSTTDVSTSDSIGQIATSLDAMRQSQEQLVLELGRIGMLLTLLVDTDIEPADVNAFLLSNQ